jgi:outer membrane protein assembly factor BamB
VNGVVYVGCNDNNIYAFDLAGGTLVRHSAEPPDPATLVPDYTLKPR